MISKKIHLSGIIDLENDEFSIHDVLEKFNTIGYSAIASCNEKIGSFDRYILKHFYDGITSSS